MSKLLKLYPMGARWYAEIQDGNMSMNGPTSFAKTMPREEVITAIKAKSPDMEICLGTPTTP